MVLRISRRLNQYLVLGVSTLALSSVSYASKTCIDPDVNEREALRKQVDVLRAEKLEVKKQLADQMSKTGILLSERCQALLEAATIADENERLQDEIEVLKGESTAYAGLAEENVRIQKENQFLLGKANAYELENRSFKERLALEIEAKLKALEDLSAVINEHNDALAEIEILHDELETIKPQLSEALARLTRTKNKHKETEEQLSSVQKDLNKTKASLLFAQLENVRAQQEIKSLNSGLNSAFGLSGASVFRAICTPQGLLSKFAPKQESPRPQAEGARQPSENASPVFGKKIGQRLRDDFLKSSSEHPLGDLSNGVIRTRE